MQDMESGHKEELKSIAVGWAILILIILGALWLGSSSSDAPADPPCVAAGYC